MADLNPSHVSDSTASKLDRFNISSYLPMRAKSMADTKAIISPGGRDGSAHPRSGGRRPRLYEHLTYVQLEALSDDFARGLRSAGVGKGTRVLMMVRQGLDLIALTFGIFKLGAVPILIDPGMGLKKFLGCVQDSQAEVMVGIFRAHVVRWVCRRAFSSVRTSLTVDNIRELASKAPDAFEMVDTARDDLAAILFTSGSTGPPKGVHYTHGIFDAQTRAIGSMYDIQEGEVALPGFPLFALFSVGLGMTCVIPDMNPAKPAKVDPRNLVEAIRDHGVEMAFGSPAIWTRLIEHLELTGEEVPSLRRILTFGAPIQPSLIGRALKTMPRAQIHTPYGATEALPVATISGSEVLEDTSGRTALGQGICVGVAAPNMEIRVIEIDDEPIDNIEDATPLPRTQIGEICVCGPAVTPRYDANPVATEASKMRGKNGRLWHRMGDVGYLDEVGRLWFCGRKAHRVMTATGTLFAVACEGVVNDHADVFRAALVGVGLPGSQTPYLIVEPSCAVIWKDSSRRRALAEELLGRLANLALAHPIEAVLYHRSFPVDTRHNAKIHRLELARWAAAQIG
jgi:olefin beta-lactone synthetase